MTTTAASPGPSPRRCSSAIPLGIGLALVLSACTTGPAPRETPSAAPAATTTPAISPEATPGSDLIVYDNDWNASGATSVLPLLAADDVTVLGVTTVTGDAWATEGTAAALSFFEKIGTTDVPVAEGRLYPLINTPALMSTREALYGAKTSWKGAFTPSEDDPDAPAVSPSDVPELPFGAAQSLAPDPLDAVDFMIEQVRAHPGEVTIVTAGPLTNVAAAVRKDPEFAGLAKAIVIGGGNLYQLSPGETDPEFNSSEGFNFRFDPESAHIVLTAGWPAITALGDVTDTVVLDDALMASITSETTPASEYTSAAAYVGNPLWDETVTAVAVDPGLITQSIQVRMDVDISEGPLYGSARVWSEADAPGLGEGLVTLVQGIDADGVADAFVDSTHATFGD